MIFFLIGASIIFTSTVLAYEVTFWKKEDFIGPKLHYVNFKLDKCVNFFEKWPHDVTWVNTHGICLEVWTEDDCQGDVKYLLSNYHNYSKLPSFRIKSFKTCQTTKHYNEQLVHKALDEHRVEHRFWQVCFRVLGMEDNYQKQVDRQGRYIDWNFILKSKQPQSRREQYDALLEQVLKRFKQFGNSKLETTNYNLEDFKIITHLAGEVFKSRARSLQTFPQDDPKYENHHQVMMMWEQLSQAITEAYHHLHRYLTRQKWIARRACENYPGFHVFFRIITPKDISLY